MSVSAHRFPELAPQDPICARSVPRRRPQPSRSLPLPTPPLPVAELLAILICGLLLLAI